MPIKVWKRMLWLCKTQVLSYMIIIHEHGHDFPCRPPLPTNLLGCTLNMCMSSSLFFYFGAKIDFNPKVGVWFWFELTQRSSICPMPFLWLFSSNIHYVHDGSWKSLAFISLATWCDTFVQFPPPLKGRWCPHHILCFLCFFASLLWNSSMVYWASSMSNSFTQDASIEWYLFHFIKYSHSCPFSCFDSRAQPLLRT
jgi:hypothetical protein